jgi:D-tyrosyl-tRNA(Tyr) deacylase
MRAVVQRVSAASVSVDGEVVGRIGAGLLAYIGVAPTDGPADIEYIAGKLTDLRIFADESGRMNRSVVEANGGLLIVSQFTLYADCRKGRRPSFDGAAPPALAESLYNELIRNLRARGLPVATGVFQAHMDVQSINDGPVTMLLDSTRAF